MAKTEAAAKAVGNLAKKLLSGNWEVVVSNTYIPNDPYHSVLQLGPFTLKYNDGLTEFVCFLAMDVRSTTGYRAEWNRPRTLHHWPTPQEAIAARLTEFNEFATIIDEMRAFIFANNLSSKP